MKSRPNSIVIIAPGPSFDVDKFEEINDTCDTLVINYAHVPIRRTYGDDITPTHHFVADKPKVSSPEEWRLSYHVNSIFNEQKVKHLRLGAHELFKGQPNNSWSSNPFRRGNRSAHNIFFGPYKTPLLAYQYALSQGYHTIGFYGVDLDSYQSNRKSTVGTYSGMAGASLKNQGRRQSYFDCHFCLTSWAKWSKSALVNLSGQQSTLYYAPHIDNMSVSEFVRETDDLHHSPAPHFVRRSEASHDEEHLTSFGEAKPDYDDLFSRGYEAKRSKSHGHALLQRLSSYDIDSYLDVGAAYGTSLDYFAQYSHRYVGVDIAELPVRKMKEKGYEAYVASITSLPFYDNEFDLVSAFDVLEHLDFSDIVRGINELCRISCKYVAVTPHPHVDVGAGRRLNGAPLHRTLMPLQRYVDIFTDNSYRQHYRRGKYLIFERV